MRDIFWHIDGHHHVFQQRSVAIPDVFSPFCNYNVPELSKHRKRRTINLSGHLMQQFVLDLCTMLHANYWSREGWCQFKEPVECLSLSLARYVDYLFDKTKRMKTHHRSPARELSTSLRVKFISESTSSTTHFESIEEALATKLVYEYIDLSELLPKYL